MYVVLFLPSMLYLQYLLLLISLKSSECSLHFYICAMQLSSHANFLISSRVLDGIATAKPSPYQYLQHRQEQRLTNAYIIVWIVYHLPPLLLSTSTLRLQACASFSFVWKDWTQQSVSLTLLNLIQYVSLSYLSNANTNFFSRISYKILPSYINIIFKLTRRYFTCDIDIYIERYKHS